MMTVLMDNGSAPPERELVQNLYKKNNELENGLRKSARSRVPSDPNTWLQMRENYETIILKDRDFSEKHEIEYALWQLHYRRIEELRSHINVAVSGPVASQGGKDPVRPDRIKKIRSVFKSFLSEATGFYHDMILKIRSEYGLPLGYFSDSPETRIIRTKDEKRSYDMKKGLLSCHRCLVYLGDLARYKGLYGEEDTVSRDYVAATSYYLNAAFLCPSSGNPHHQLAILASYSGDDLMSVYRYFRSLAVDNPFSTARDNLIIAFEKNRQNYSQLPGNTKVASARTVPARSAGRGRGRGDTRIKDIKTETIPTKEQDLSIPELLKAFCVRFVRLNGILFTRTSLETFDEIFSLVISDLHELLRSGPEEELNFCQDVAESRLTIVRLITILIFTVHNVSRESEGQSYAEILQRSVLLQNAFTAAFEFSGHVLKRCLQLRDAASSNLLSAILVFMEWLACHPDIAAGCDVEEKQANARSFFWNQCISFLNKLILSRLGSVGGINQDENTFSEMIRYDDWDTGNRPALCEDFELRGFLPLVPAQVILDFSGNCSFESEGSLKEKRARVQRILAAGRALTDAVSVDQQGIYFDPKLNKFLFGVKPLIYEDNMHTGLSNVHESKSLCEGNLIESPFDLGMPQLSTGQVEMELLKESLYTGDDEEEEIVFKPMVVEKSSHLNASKSTAYEIIQPVHFSSKVDWETFSAPLSSLNNIQMSTACEIIQPVHFSSKADWETFSAPLSSLNNIQLSTVLNASPLLHSHTPSVSQQPSQHVSRNTKKWLVEQETKLYNSLNTMNINGNDPLVKHGPQEATFQPSALFSAPPIMNSINAISGEMRVTEPVIPSTLDSIVPSGATCDSLTMKTFSALPMAARKSPVSRPVRHHGPPPGFTHVQPKQLDYPISHPLVDQNRQFDDFSWLDGYKSSSTNGMGMMCPSNYNGDYINNSDNDKLAGASTFLFPGKQTANVQTSAVKEQLWQDFQLFEHLNPYSEQKFQPANLTAASLPEHHHASSIWSNSNFL